MHALLCQYKLNDYVLYIRYPSPPVTSLRVVFKGEDHKTGFGDLDLCLHWVYHINLHSLHRPSIENQDVAWIQTVSRNAP